MSDLFDAIEAHLEAHAARASRQREVSTATARAKWERHLWEAIRPFIRTEADFRAAAGFMAHMTRERSRD